MYEAGGMGLIYLFGCVLFIASITLLTVVAPLLGVGSPEPNEKQVSVLQMLRVPTLWAVTSLKAMVVGTTFLFEPLWPLVLRGQYDLPMLMYGFICQIPIMGGAVSSLLLGAWLYTCIGCRAQLCVGGFIFVLCLLFFGPSQLLGFVPKSIAQFLIHASLAAVAFGLIFVVSPVVSLLVMAKDAGLSKKECSGSLAATDRLFCSIFALILPNVGMLLYDASSAETFSTVTAAFALAILVPLALMLTRYDEKEK
jgi:hypothetical protein